MNPMKNLNQMKNDFKVISLRYHKVGACLEENMQPAAVSIPTQAVMPQTEPQFKDKEANSINGFIGLLIHLSLSVFNILLLATGPGALLLIITGPIWLVLWNSYVIVNPNEAVVTQFFGKYVSTLKTEGFRFFFQSSVQQVKDIIQDQQLRI